MMTDKKAVVIGGGLAGVEAANQLSKRGIKVTLYEMKPQKYSPAHKSGNLGELVCSNSLKAERVGSAAGLLKAEMRLFDSVCLKAADRRQKENPCLGINSKAREKATMIQGKYTGNTDRGFPELGRLSTMMGKWSEG